MVDHGAGLGIAVEIVERNPADRGFVPQPIRWRVEQTNGILMLHRRLVLRTPPGLGRVTGVLGDKRRDGPSAGGHLRPGLARRVSLTEAVLRTALTTGVGVRRNQTQTRESLVTAASPCSERLPDPANRNL